MKNDDLAKFNNKIYIVATLLMLGFGAIRITTIPAAAYPEPAIKYIMNAKVSPNLLSNYEWSGYLEYMLYPEYKIMVNGRLNAPLTIIQEYSNIYNAKGDYKNFITQNNINSFLLSYEAPLIGELPKNYKAAYFDDKDIIFVNTANTDKYFKYLKLENENEFYSKNNYDRAFDELKGFASDYPSEKACLMLAMMYRNKNRKQAIEYLNETISEHHDYNALYNFLGKIYFNGMEYGKAEDIWSKSGSRTKEINALLKTAKNKSKFE